jgi:DtxR family Mn-dependent transcriptional regulator
MTNAIEDYLNAILEHVVSEGIEARIFELLERPSHYPHESPMRERSREMPQNHSIPLSAMSSGQSGMVVEVSDRSAELFRYLFEYGVVPGVRVTVKELVPFGGSIRVSLDSAEDSLGIQAAENVFVDRMLE